MVAMLEPETQQPASLWALIWDALQKYGLGVVVSLYLMYWLTQGVSIAIAATRVELIEHARLSAFYSHQICINTARDELAARLCEPPENMTR